MHTKVAISIKPTEKETRDLQTVHQFSRGFTNKHFIPHSYLSQCMADLRVPVNPLWGKLKLFGHFKRN